MASAEEMAAYALPEPSDIPPHSSEGMLSSFLSILFISPFSSLVSFPVSSLACWLQFVILLLLLMVDLLAITRGDGWKVI